MQPRQVSWCSKAEWLYVHDLLFSSTRAEVQLGLDHVDMWISRGPVPTAIEATANLLRLSLADSVDYGRQSTAPPDANTLRLMYAAAIIRFVNEAVDPGQKGAFAQPITRLADSIGLPRLLVDLRHEATHDVLPALEAFRIGARLGMEWLKERYWRVMLEADEFERAMIGEALERLKESENYSRKNVAKVLSEIDYAEQSPNTQRLIAEIVTTSPFIEAEQMCTMLVDIMARWSLEFKIHLVKASFHAEAACHKLVPLIKTAFEGERLPPKQYMLILRLCMAADDSTRALELVQSLYVNQETPERPRRLYQILTMTAESADPSVFSDEPAHARASASDASEEGQQPEMQPTWQEASGTKEEWAMCPLGCTLDFDPSFGEHFRGFIIT